MSALPAAGAYIRLLFAIELLLLAASVLLHGTVFFLGATEPYVQYSHVLVRAGVLIGILVFAFVKDGLRWIDQIKSCPKWMWRGSLIAGVYALLTFFFAHPTLTLSGFSIAFDAISICILYSVLSKDYLENAEMVRRSLHSILMAAVIVTVVVLYRAGYLHHLGR